jgi:hypothetical protein
MPPHVPPSAMPFQNSAAPTPWTTRSSSLNIEGVVVDFFLALPGYEEQIVTRAVRCDLGDLQAWVCAPEDLIIQKAIAGRAKDWQDIEGILIEQYDHLDLNYLEDWLSQFAELLEQPEILARYCDIQIHIAAIRC